MMTNLFSSFDPTSSSLFMTNWFSSLIFLTLLLSPFWAMKNRKSIIFTKIFTTLHLEFKTLLGASSFNGTTLLFISIFTIIVFNNFMGLFPYIFTSTSHMALTLALSLPLWVSFMLYGWINNMKHMFAHLVPQSTPGVLMPFMVLIESVSNLIRPGTLAVRLAANMIAGHLLMTLLGNQTAAASITLIPFLLIMQVMLLTLESAVALIQSYVFAVLTTLYSSEVVPH